MAGQVAGKVALVTGGASGIGEAVSELLAREGASVAVTDIDDLRGPELVARIRKAGGEATFWHQDVTSEEQWIDVVAEVVLARWPQAGQQPLAPGDGAVLAWLAHLGGVSIREIQQASSPTEGREACLVVPPLVHCPAR